jgi:glycosyltransferase involved in cell wall biosynthesis
MEATLSLTEHKQPNRRLRIAHIVQHLQPGGIETMVVNMANSMKGTVASRVISLQGQSEELLQNWKRLSSLQTPWMGFAKAKGVTPSLVLQLKNYLQENKIEVVHTHHIGPLLYGGIAARMAGCRVVHTEHDAWHLESFRRRTLQQAILRLVNPTVIADAKYVASAFEKNTRVRVAKIIPNGVDMSQFRSGNKGYARAHLGLRQNVFWVGSAGRLEPVKDHKTLLDALVTAPSDVHLVIAGNGSQAIDCFCLPSLKEGYPLAKLEAQACSVPCIVTDTGGSTEALCPLTGIAVPVQRPDLLSNAISKLYHHPAKCDPREHVFEHNHFAHTISKYLGVYSQGANE